MEKNEKVANALVLAKANCRKNEKVAIGIDMGTSTCTVGVYQNGKVEIILNEGENDVKPTFVGGSEKDENAVEDVAKPPSTPCCGKTDLYTVPRCPKVPPGLMGGPPGAGTKCASSPRSTICDMMKLVGKGFFEQNMDEEMKMVPFRVTNVGGQQVLEVMCKKVERKHTPVDLSQMIFQKVKEVAESYLGRPVNDAVITVPVYFNEFEKKATKEAATNAGFRVLRLMNEPVAAAVAYGLLQQDTTQYALVFDLGGGTLDVSVLCVGNGVIDLKATSGNTHLGVKDFNSKMVAHFVQEILDKHGIDVRTNKLAMERLQQVCEQAKRCLSKYENAAIKIQDLADGVNFKSSISRAKFEELNAELFNSTLDSVEDALDDANVPKECIGKIVLVGGSTKIPKIQSLLKEFFDGKELTQAVNPDEAIAFGAAIEAAVMAEEEFYKSDEVVYDFAPLSIGIKTAGGVMDVFIPRNTPLPCSVTHQLSTYADNQPSVLIQIYEGEKRLAKDNYHLADLELSGLPPARRGVPIIDVTFCVDKSGIMIVSAKERSTGVNSKIMITKTKYCGIQVEKMVEEPIIIPVIPEEEESSETPEPCCFEISESSDETDLELLAAKASDIMRLIEPRPEIICQPDEIRTCCAPLSVRFRETSSSSSTDKSTETSTDKTTTTTTTGSTS